MKIFIDAGHNNNGWNTGATGYNLKEQDVTFYVAKYLGEILESHGIEIKLSRPTLLTNLGVDNSSSISSRYTMANEWRADYFISIHCNAGGGTGAETLYYKNDSLDYAGIIQSTYITETGLRDRGVKYRDNIGVIRYTNMPAILLELAFIDNGNDADILANRQMELAKAIASGFFKLLGINPEEAGGGYRVPRYEKVEDMPAWAQDTVNKLIRAGYLTGDGNGNYNLSEDMIRLLVINERAGLYGE